MELSSEDNLRINVLLAQEVNAIRINESSMILHALLKEREARIQLHPNCKDERYLKLVRELLSTHYLDSPAGFPVLMHRWSRMQQSGKENLDGLLKIGEPEAVIYAINSPKLSAEQAQYAWWAMPCTEVAVQLLQNDHVIKSALAKELSDFLLEFLPFETESTMIITVVRLLITNGLLSTEQQINLWRKGQKKANYLIGFIHCDPRLIPVNKKAHTLFQLLEQQTNQQEFEHPVYQQLRFLLSQTGQNYLQAILTALEKYTDQESVIGLYKSLESRSCEVAFKQHSPLPGLNTDKNTEIESLLKSVLRLNTIKESQLNQILAQSNAVGSVLRKQLEPVTSQLAEALNNLLQHENSL